MTYEELKEFKRNTADAALNKIFERIELKEGMGFIDFIEVTYLDGRNCGYDKHFVAKGYEYIDGEVRRYEYEALDITAKEFLEQIKYPLISYGQFIVYDEINSMEIVTHIGVSARCGQLFEELESMKDIKPLSCSEEYEKMNRIYDKKTVEEPSIELKLWGEKYVKSNCTV